MERLVPEKETIKIVFQRDRKPIPDDVIIDSVVAFANTDGGDLYPGIEDDGSITGPSYQGITRLAEFIANKSIPPQAVRVELIDETYPVIRIQVAKSRSIIASSSGKTLRRQIKMDGTPETEATSVFQQDSSPPDDYDPDQASRIVPFFVDDDLALWMLIQLMRKSGVEVILTDSPSEHYAIMDGKLVWYGGMNLLGREDAWDNLIRVESIQAAVELLEMTVEAKALRTTLL